MLAFVVYGNTSRLVWDFQNTEVVVGDCVAVQGMYTLFYIAYLSRGQATIAVSVVMVVLAYVFTHHES